MEIASRQSSYVRRNAQIKLNNVTRESLHTSKNHMGLGLKQFGYGLSYFCKTIFRFLWAELGKAIQWLSFKGMKVGKHMD